MNTTAALEQLTRANLDAHTIARLHRARNWTKADVAVVAVDGQRAVVKDIRRRPLLFRLLVGRRLLQREFQILSRLQGVRGVPQVLRMMDADALLMEEVEGEVIGRLRCVGEATLAQLAETIDELHRRGIAHGDPHGYNVVVAADGTSYLIDFSLAYVARASRGRWRERVWREMRNLDWRQLAKLKSRLLPQSLTAEERRLLEEPSGFYRLGKGLRRLWNALTLKGWRVRLGMLTKSPVEKLKLVALFAFVGALLWWAQPAPHLFGMGLAVAALGEAIRLWAAGHLERNQRLVISGPYAHCRNPLYVGRFLLLSGFCLMTGYWYLLPPALLIFVVYYLLRKVRREEERLRSLFGTEYDQWERAVPAIFPRLTPYRRDGKRWNLQVFLGNKEHWTLLVEAVLVLWIAWWAWG